MYTASNSHPSLSGTGGLGLEMCIAMAESGANIVSIHLPNDPAQSKLEEAVTAIGRKVTGFPADVGDSTELRKTFHDIWEAGIVPDILLNCAGLNRRGPIEQMTDDKIDLVSPRPGLIPSSTGNLGPALADASLRSSQ